MYRVYFDTHHYDIGSAILWAFWNRGPLSPWMHYPARRSYSCRVASVAFSAFTMVIIFGWLLYRWGMKWILILSVVSPFRPDNYSVHPLHGWGGAAWGPNCHHLPGETMLLWLTSFPEIPPWIWLLPHSCKKGGPKQQHSQQHQCLHQHQHQQHAYHQGMFFFV